MPWNKPRPNVDYDNQAFWDAVRQHEFKIWRCKTCGAWYWPFSHCRNHENEPWGTNVEITKASGRGKVFAFEVSHIAFDPTFKDDLPYVYALIELDEGPMFGTNVVGCAPKDVKIGMPVEVVFEDIDNEFTLPKVRPLRAPSPRR